MQKILLIDDDPRTTETMKKMLEMKKEYKVYTAGGGREGLTAARVHRPDLILLDIIMPEMDGFEVLQELKEHARTRRIPVIMLTGTADSNAVKDSMYWYADEYMAKPIGLEDLLAKVTKRLEMSTSAADAAKGKADRSEG